MNQWYFNPILAEIGPFKIHWYGVMYAVSFILGYFYLHYSEHGKRLKINGEQKDLFLALIIACVLIGGRLGYVLFYNLPFYLANPTKIIAVWEGGMSFHGGLIGCAIGILWFCRKYRVKFLELGDVAAAFAPLGVMFVRIGNFINGELYGRIATQFCLYFPSDPTNCRYPSQLFQALLEGLILFLILFFIRKYTKRPGVISAWFLILYGVFRIIVEQFREPDVQIGYLFGGITEGQLLSSIMILAGISIFIFLRKKQLSKPL